MSFTNRAVSIIGSGQELGLEHGWGVMASSDSSELAWANTPVAERKRPAKACDYVPSRVASSRADMGDCPVWDEHRHLLYFVDITGGRINCLTPRGKVERVYEAAARIGALALTDQGNLIFTEDANVAILDVALGHVRLYSAPVHHSAGLRLSDGACDPAGRFVTGLMDQGVSGIAGALYRFDHHLQGQIIRRKLAQPNGLAWSADGQKLYFVDSSVRAIYCADYFCGGALGAVSLFAETPAELGRPSGIALDRAGGLWVCQLDGSCVLRYDRSGQISEQVLMPVPRPTSVCFAGEGLDTLYITTARVGMTPVQLLDYPEAGELFRIRPAVGGIRRHRFKE